MSYSKLKKVSDRLEYLEEVKDRWVQLHRMFGRWFQYHALKWYVVKGYITYGDGWESSDSYHCDVVAEFDSETEATAALKALNYPTNHFVASPGLTITEYASLPDSVKIRKAYDFQLTQTEWDEFRQRMDLVKQANMEAYATVQTERKQNVQYTVDPTEIAGVF